MIQLTHSQLVIKFSSAKIKKLREQFKKQGFLRFPSFLGDALKRYVRQALRNAVFFDVNYENVGTELQMKENAMDHAILFALNDPCLFRFLEQIGDCGPLHSYIGRPYSFIPGCHGDTWHQDTMAQRKLALSINLSEKPYEGGILRIREKKTRKMIADVKNTVFGDAILFKIDRRLEHCLTPVTGKAPKTAYAGWFSPLPNEFLKVKKLKQKAACF